MMGGEFIKLIEKKPPPRPTVTVFNVGEGGREGGRGGGRVCD